jgi:hypothetical protein
VCHSYGGSLYINTSASQLADYLESSGKPASQVAASTQASKSTGTSQPATYLASQAACLPASKQKAANAAVQRPAALKRRLGSMVGATKPVSCGSWQTYARRHFLDESSTLQSR